MIIEVLISIGLVFPSIPAELSATPIEFSNPVFAVRIYPPDADVVRLSALPLPEETQIALADEFENIASYYGAFAVTKEGSYGYSMGSNSIEAARDVAMAECLAHGPSCLIYSEILPAGYTPHIRGEASLSAEATEMYETINSRPRFRGMAVSEDGAYSVVWGHQSQEEADAAALDDCSDYVISDLDNLREMPCVVLPVK